MLCVSTCPKCATDIPSAPDPETGLVRCDACGTVFDPHQGETATDARATAERAAVDADPSGLQAGAELGAYVLEEPLGSGGMACVWRARQTQPARPVAIKILKPMFARDSGIRKRFGREADALSRLDHPNILPIIDGGEDPDRDLPYIVTPLVDTTLRKVLRDGSGRPVTLAPQRLLGIATQVARALEHAHRCGMVHRDVKPENILLDADDRVRLADFGIARLKTHGDATAFTELTRTDQVIGTYAYMAPEQSESGRRVDHRADLYALGMVLYECLTGHRPQGLFEPPAERVPGLTHRQRRYWNKLILRLLERDPAKRPESASTVIAALARTAHLHEAPDGAEDIPVREAVRDDPASRAWTGRGRRAGADACDHGHRLYRATNEGVVAGVCSGLARWTGIDVLWWRLAAIVTLFINFGVTVLVYLCLVLFLPTCRDPRYRPRPLNARLPRREPGLLFGVCEMLGHRTHVDPWVWRLIALVTIGFGSWIVYLILAVALPGPGAAVPPRQARTTAAVPPEPRDAGVADRSAVRFWGVLCLGLLLMVGGSVLVRQEIVVPAAEARDLGAGGGSSPLPLLCTGSALLAGLLAFISLFVHRAWPVGLGTGGGLVVLSGIFALLGLGGQSAGLFLPLAAGALLVGLGLGLLRRRQDVLYASFAVMVAFLVTVFWMGS